MWQESCRQEIAELFLDAQSVTVERARRGFIYLLDLRSADVAKVKAWQASNPQRAREATIARCRAWRLANKGRPRNRKPEAPGRKHRRKCKLS